MLRRDVIKLLTSSAVLSAVPTEAIVLLQKARADAGSTNWLRTLNAHQNETVTTICELIIPETDTPGAKGAKVNEFIDLMLTDWFDRPSTDHFLQQLDSVDATSRKMFGKDFVRSKPAQQAQLMKQMDDEALQLAHAQQSAPLKSSAPLTTTNFFYTLKKMTLLGYYTSEIGFQKELGKSIIPPGHDGCAPLEVR